MNDCEIEKKPQHFVIVSKVLCNFGQEKLLYMYIRGLGSKAGTYHTQCCL